MTYRKGECCLAAVLIAAVAACEAPPDQAVIGTAYVWEDASVVSRLVRRELEVREGAVTIRLASLDASVLPQGAEAGLERAVAEARATLEVPHLLAVVGHSGSRDALLAAPVYNRAQVPVVVPTATTRLLREGGEWIFALAPDDSAEGEFIARFVAEELRPQSVAIVYIRDEYGTGLRAGAAAALRRLGVPVTAEVSVGSDAVCPPDAPGNTYAAQIAPLEDDPPDVTVLAVRDLESGCLIPALAEINPAMRFVGGDGIVATNQRFLHRAGAAAESLYVAAFWHPDIRSPQSRAFVEVFRGEGEELPSHRDAMIYDAVHVLIAAISAVGPDRAAVRDYLRDLGDGHPPYPGVTGPVTFRPGKTEPLVMTRIRDGRWVLVNE